MTTLESLIDLLDLEGIELNLFRGRSPQERSQRVFGGQVVGQALVAATRTVAGDRLAHSLKGDFLRPGDPKTPILYEVDRIRDGKSFNTRRVVAIQHGKAIFAMSVGFQKEEKGLEHQMPMPDVPRPDDLPDPEIVRAEARKRAPEEFKHWYDGNRAFEQKVIDPVDEFDPEKRPPLHGRLGALRRFTSRRSSPSPMPTRLRVRHEPSRHLRAASRRLVDGQTVSGGQPRSLDLVSPRLSRRRMDAVRTRRACGRRRSRLQPGLGLYRERRTGGIDVPRRADSVSWLARRVSPRSIGRPDVQLPLVPRTVWALFRPPP